MPPASPLANNSPIFQTRCHLLSPAHPIVPVQLERVIKAASNSSSYSWCTCSEEICEQQLGGRVRTALALSPAAASALCCVDRPTSWLDWMTRRCSKRTVHG